MQLEDWQCWTSARSFTRLPHTAASGTVIHPPGTTHPEFQHLDSGRRTEHKFEISDTLSSYLETVATTARKARGQQIVLGGDVVVSRLDVHRETQELFYVEHENMST